MNSKNIGKAIVMMAVIGVLILLAVNTSAVAQEGGEDRIRHEETEADEETRAMSVPGGPGFVSIPAISLRMYRSSYEWAYYSYELYNPSSSGIFAEGPVYLPNGAEVNKLTLYYYDDAAGDIVAFLVRKALGSSFCQNLAEITSTTNSGYGNDSDTELVDTTIDNQNYTYFVEVWIPGSFDFDLRVNGLRIDYGFDSYLPTIMK